MPKRFERLDQTIGRLVFRTVGTAFAVISLICLYVAYRHATDWYADSPAPALMFSVIAVAVGSLVPYCLSRKRTFTEALDALESEVPDWPRRPRN